ncbi:MAG: fibronectin type III domain-containing protein [bacterium]|nr:fibronectin type III domain-containing protein [bacterium]
MRNAFLHRIPIALFTFVFVSALITACTEKAKNTVTEDVTVNAPTQLQATRNAQGDVVFLQWLDNADNESGFVIERSSVRSDSGYRIISTIATENITSFSDSTAPYDSICYYRVAATAGEHVSNYSNVAIRLLNPVNAPRLYEAIRDSVTGFVWLTWQDFASNEAGFVIERTTLPTDTNFLELVTIASNTTEYYDSSAPLSVSCSYRIRAIAGTMRSAYSNILRVSAVILTAPDNFSATRTYPNEVVLYWSDQVDNTVGFVVERSITSASSGFDTLATLEAHSITYTDTTAPVNNICYYRVFSVFVSLRSEYSNVVSVPIFTIAPPQSMIATRLDSMRVNFSWFDFSNNETGFVLERSTLRADSGYRTVAVIPANRHEYLDSTAKNDSTYYYRLFAVVRSLRSAASNIVTVPMFTIVPPGYLSGGRRNDMVVDLQWIDFSNNETGFLVERSTSRPDSGYRVISTLAANYTMYTDLNAPFDSTYYYRVCAVANSFRSAYTNVRTVYHATMNAPRSLTASRIGIGLVILRWMDGSINEARFVIERSIAASDTGYQIIGHTSTNVVSFSDTTAPIDSICYYRVFAQTGNLRSSYSNTYALPLNLDLQAPSDLHAKRRTSNSIQVNWIDRSSYEESYQIERSIIDQVSGFQLIGTQAPDANSFIDTLAPTTRAHFYRVRATGGHSFSPYSAVRFVPINQTPSSSVTLLSPANGATNQNLGVNLRWSPAPDPLGETTFYNVYLSPQSAPGAIQQVANGITSTNFLTGRLDMNTTYRWKVVAFDAFHLAPPPDSVPEATFTTSDNTASWLDWNDIPHTGVVTLYGSYSNYSAQVYPEYHLDYDTTFTDSLQLDLSRIFLATPIGGDISFEGRSFTSFPLIVGESVVNVDSIVDLSRYLSNSRSNVYTDFGMITTQDILVGSENLTCTVMRCWTDTTYFGPGGSSPFANVQTNVSVCLTPGLGVVRVYVGSSSYSGNRFSVSSHSRSSVYTIRLP